MALCIPVATKHGTHQGSHVDVEGFFRDARVWSMSPRILTDRLCTQNF